jgi:hypothetical protein
MLADISHVLSYHINIDRNLGLSLQYKGDEPFRVLHVLLIARAEMLL